MYFNINKYKLNNTKKLDEINITSYNFNHIIFVLQYTYLLILETKLKNDVDDYELFALMISALVHDIDHPGYNNQFMIHTKNTIAEKYNYISVLENHHINITFNILDKINLLNNLSSNKYNKIKAIIYSCVISTDMTNNDILINKFNNKIKETILGIPISEFMIVHNNQSIYQNELKFCINIVKPNIDSIIKLFPNLEHIRDNLNYNIEILEELTYNQIN